MGAVGANAPDPRGQMDNDLWRCRADGSAPVCAVAQIIVLTAGHENALAAALAQFPHYPHPEKARTTGDHDAPGSPILHTLSPYSNLCATPCCRAVTAADHWCHPANLVASVCWPWPMGCRPIASISASIMIAINSSNVTLGSQPSCTWALVASAWRQATSVGRK